MKIVVAGGSGFIGEPLVRRLVAAGHDVAVLSRRPAKVQAGRGLQWDARSQGAWSAEAAAADVVINLAGENIGEGRWSEERKRRMIESRLNATGALVEAFRTQPPHARTLINASAVGVYGDRADEVLDEFSPAGRGFLAEMATRWEAAAREAEPLARLVILRFGVVLAPDGGALAKMLLPFKLGAGGPIGNGRQWMSWVDRDDLLRMVEWAIANESVRGVYNVTAPAAARNRDFARALGRALHRPAFLPAPAFALKLALGQMADEALLVSQHVRPVRAEREGFTFTYPTLDESLAHQFAR